MADAPRPTVLNSLTHYALTEDQQEVMEQGPEKLREILAKTNTDPSDTRVVQAVAAGVLLPESVIRQETEPAPPGNEEARQKQEQENKEKQEQENKTRQQEQKREERHDDKRGR